MAGRVTNIALEVLTEGNATARVTTVALEVLVSVAESSAIEIPVGAGALEFTGLPTEVITPTVIEVPAGALQFTGSAPVVSVPMIIEVGAGELLFAGGQTLIENGVNVALGRDQLVLQGQAPFVSVENAVQATQQAVLLLGEIVPSVRGSQQAGLLLAEIIPDVAASQQAVLILADGSPCVTSRCQIWTITRRDGVVFRYTSHDQDVRYGGQVYSSCRSLDPSASENASTLGSVGNIELEGIIDDDGISEADLYGGLFDDAYVTVDLIAWDGAEAPRRLASGWTGELSQGETGFKMEVLGAGARLDQQALVQMVTPGCRWVFGSPECGVDVEALAIGGTVTASASRGRFLALLDAGDGGLQWGNGRLRWTSGANVGQVVEVKSVDFDTGDVVLWASPAFLPEPGDAFDLLPGCDFVREGGCTVYANVINFGGFPDVPGSDSLLETPDAKY